MALKAVSEISSIAFLISLLDRSRYLKQLLRVWLVNPLKYFTSQPASWHSCMRSAYLPLFFCCWLVQSFLQQGQSVLSPHTFYSVVELMVTSGCFAVTTVTDGNIAGLLSSSQTISQSWNFCILSLLSVLCHSTLSYLDPLLVLNAIPDFWYPSLLSSVNYLARWIAGTMWWTIFCSTISCLHQVVSSCS